MTFLLTNIMQKLKNENSRRLVTLTFPMASSPLSKKKIIPRNEKKIPNPVSPSPISIPFQISTNKHIMDHTRRFRLDKK